MSLYDSNTWQQQTRSTQILVGSIPPSVKTYTGILFINAKSTTGGSLASFFFPQEMHKWLLEHSSKNGMDLNHISINLTVADSKKQSWSQSSADTWLTIDRTVQASCEYNTLDTSTKQTQSFITVSIQDGVILKLLHIDIQGRGWGLGVGVGVGDYLHPLCSPFSFKC